MRTPPTTPDHRETTGGYMMRRRILAAGLLSAVLTVSLARAAEVLRVGTPEATALNMSLIDVGVQSGIFAKYGLDVQRMDFAGSAKLYPAMAAGSVDLAMGSGSDLLFITRGLPMKAVAVWQTKPNDLSLMTVTNGPKTVADLKSKKVGVAGPGGLTLWVAMSASNQQGWGPNGMTYVYLGGVPSIVAGLLSGNVDAVVSSTDSGVKLEAEKRGRFLALGGDVVGPFLAHLVFASQEVMDKRPQVLRNYLKAWYETVAWARAHKDDTVRITDVKTGLTPELGDKLFDIMMPVITSDGHFDPTALTGTVQALVALGQVKAEDLPPESTFYTESFLK
jgi:NitT/TauT family transport system substrate-binding protein